MSTVQTGTGELSLKQKTVRGSLYQVLGRFFLRFLKVVKTITIARFLFPDDVGLFVLASLIIGLTEMFLQSGFQAAIVQRDVVERRHLDGVWTVHCIKNILLGVGIYFGAPLVATFFATDALTPVLQVLAFLYLIESVVNIGTILIQKEMRFGRQLLYDSSYVLTELVATVIFAYFLRDVWALVYGALVGRLASVVFSYVFHEYRPKFTSDFSGARELFTFGRWIWLTSIFLFIASKLDSFFIGKFLSIKDLGLYQLALSLALIPAVEVSRSLATVLFPLFSKIQGNSELFHGVVIQSFKIVGLVTIPMATGLYILSDPIVRVIYGVMWEPAIPILKVLSIFGLLKSLEYVCIAFIQSSGKPKIVSYSTIFQVIFLTILLYPSIQIFGVIGVGVVLSIGTFISILYFLVISIRLLHMQGNMSLIVLSIPLFSSAVMAVVLIVCMEYFSPVGAIALFLYIVAGAVIYSFTTLIVDWYTGKQYYHQIDKLLSGKISNSVRSMSLK